MPKPYYCPSHLERDLELMCKYPHIQLLLWVIQVFIAVLNPGLLPVPKADDDVLKCDS
jgi:hypothetical protein